jgi:cytochrome c-type biogenesis protein CcmH
MLTFWIIAALFVLLILWFVLPPFFDTAPNLNPQTTTAANVLIYQNQLEELASDFKAGLIGEEQYRQEKDAIERRLLEDVKAEPSPHESSSRRITKLGYAVAAFIPVGAVTLYLFVGNPQALSSTPAATAMPTSSAPQPGDMSQQQIAANVDKLAARLKQNPDDAQGWLMLARSYVSMERFPEAASAYEQLTTLNANDANVWADYAVAMAMANNQHLAGKPTEAINRALQIDPKNQKALDLAGSAAFQAADYQKAINYWRKLMSSLPPGSEELTRVSDQIARAKELAGDKGSR